MKSDFRATEESITFNSEVVNCLFENYDAENIFVKPMPYYSVAQNIWLCCRHKCVEAFVTKALRGGDVYNEHVLKIVFIEGLHESIRESMPSYCTTYLVASVYSVAPSATFFYELKKRTNIFYNKSLIILKT